jgi:hypothetical protein
MLPAPGRLGYSTIRVPHRPTEAGHISDLSFAISAAAVSFQEIINVAETAGHPKWDYGGAAMWQQLLFTSARLSGRSSRLNSVSTSFGPAPSGKLSTSQPVKTRGWSRALLTPSFLANFTTRLPRNTWIALPKLSRKPWGVKIRSGYKSMKMLPPTLSKF